jgi:hypothetical protein
MNRTSQWLFETPFVSESDRYTNPYTNKENSSPKLVPRCRSLDLTIPSSYKGLEEAVQNWIHTCTMSKTEGGAPVHRERRLVIGNPSLIDIWNKILRYRMGQKTTIVPEYIWGPNRVESIRFTTTSLPPPPDIGNADFTRFPLRYPGFFSTTSDLVQYVHKNTPSNRKFTQRSCQFIISTYWVDLRAHDIHVGDYWFQLEFQYNGNDLIGVSIKPLPAKSQSNPATFYQDRFTTTFTGRPKSIAAAPVAEIIYDIAGTWDARGQSFPFNGTIIVSANGGVWRTFSPDKDNRVRHVYMTCK